jgi:hypothetical protein
MVLPLEFKILLLARVLSRLLRKLLKNSKERCRESHRKLREVFSIHFLVKECMKVLKLK